jgi:hypothetical protein
VHLFSYDHEPAGSPLGGAPAPRPLSAFRPPLRPLASFVSLGVGRFTTFTLMS